LTHANVKFNHAFSSTKQEAASRDDSEHGGYSREPQEMQVVWCKAGIKYITEARVIRHNKNYFKIKQEINITKSKCSYFIVYFILITIMLKNFKEHESLPLNFHQEHGGK